MISKQITTGPDARLKLKDGVDNLANAVKVTLGPLGRNVVIEGEMHQQHVTKDGVTVAKSIFLEDKIQNIGAQIVKQAAAKTATNVGDGTTTSTVLAQSMIEQGLQNITAGASPIGIKRGIDAAVEQVVDDLKEMSEKIGNDKEKLKHIACISSNNDESIGKLISDAIAEVTDTGVVIAQESQSSETYVEYMMGMQYNHGYLSPYFINDKGALSCDFKEAFIFIYDGTISNIKDVLPILEAAQAPGKPLLIIANDVVGQALGMMVVNVVRAGLKICATKSPGFGHKRRAILDDIASLTGATVYNAETLKQFESSGLGTCKQVVVKRGQTSLVDGGGTAETVQSRVDQIKRQIETESSDYEKEQLQMRLSKMTSGAAVIHVGAATEIELKEKKDRIDDAIHATKAAIEQGFLPGGGLALLRAGELLEDKFKDSPADEMVGVRIVKGALISPMETICNNAGLNGSLIVEQTKTKDVNVGYNAKVGEFQNLIDAGVIDPTKVAIAALQNAASVTGMILTTECVVNKIESSDSVAQNPYG